ncbi:uncharacterized protein LOC110711338 [Chenopodium quinoa]|uniref:uncharacterized protein LOC110711338 n=1 Tax=Chenopodium quinoa TaxID=63459 RepID=UPI000B78BADE|nr:uncharacterized protein LOC110711338 [Chenopodium quinoa]
MIYSVWNVRGLNDPGKVASVRRLLHSHSVDIVGLLETKIKLKNVLTYQKKFGSSWLWLCNYEHSPKGRIWLGWNVDRVTVNVLKIHEQLSLWEGLRSISIQHSSWLCVGDYNFVLHASDRLHGADVTDYETRDFQHLVDDLDLTELKSRGSFYSWSNKAHTGPRTLSRLDRAFGRPFLFLNYNADHPDFLDTVSQAWGSGSSVWQILNSVKSSIKSLTSKQFGNIEEKIDQANDELSRIQTLMAQNPDDLDLYAKESDAITVLLKDPDAISHEIISFYKSLLRTQAPWLPAVDLVTMRRGKQLSSVAQSYLIRPISHAEIDVGLKGIDNTRAPGIDGFNSFFFKRVWHIVKNDIYASVIDFLNNGILPRLAAVIGEVIDDAQAGFIHGKHIGDNILLATELIKGYDHKFISPRCMVKVDLKKAYDSVEWGFLITVMQELGFPQRFVDWIKNCLTSVSYSILINGFPAPPPPLKLRQG